MKNRKAYSVGALWAVPARPEGTAPKIKRNAITFLGPYLSTNGPAITRRTRVAARAMMLEFPTCAFVRWRSDLMASGMSGGKANHERKATKKPTMKRLRSIYSYVEEKLIQDLRQLR